MSMVLTLEVPPLVSRRDISRRLGMSMRTIKMLIDSGEISEVKMPGNKTVIASTVDAWISRSFGEHAIKAE